MDQRWCKSAKSPFVVRFHFRLLGRSCYGCCGGCHRSRYFFQRRIRRVVNTLGTAEVSGAACVRRLVATRALARTVRYRLSSGLGTRRFSAGLFYLPNVDWQRLRHGSIRGLQHRGQYSGCLHDGGLRLFDCWLHAGRPTFRRQRS